MKPRIRTVIILCIGVVLGRLITTHGGQFVGLLRRHVAKPRWAAPARTGGEAWFGDFESGEDLSKRWKLHDVVATLSDEHVTHGHHSAKVTFQASESPAFKIEGGLEAFPSGTNWSGYTELSFDLYNAQPSQERLILQLKDQDGRRYKEDLMLNGHASQHVTVRLADLHEYLDAARLAQFSLFRWKPKSTATFYVDAIGLHGASAETTLLASTSAESHPSSSAEAGRSSVEDQHHVSGEVWLSDFESDDELSRRWTTRDAIVTKSSQHVTHGTYSAQVTYQDAEAPAFQLASYLASGGHGDWRGYAMLSFDLYNAQPTQERVLLQVTDKDGRQYKEDIHINGQASQHLTVHLSDLHDYLDLAHIKAFELFRWKPKGTSTFYVDAVRLQPPMTSAAAPEATGPKLSPIHPTDRWQLAWASSLTKVLRDPAKFEGSTSTSIQLSLARGEYESTQLVLVGGAQPAQVRVSVGPLTQAGGTGSIPPGVVEVRRVGYVTTHEPAYPVTFVGDWPDPLPREDHVEVPAGQMQPMWITVGAPEARPAGRYDGTITVSDAQGRTEQVAMRVTVWDFTLSRTSHLKTAFDFYPSRLKEAYNSFVPGGADRVKQLDGLVAQYYLDMLKHRVFPIIGADPISPRFSREIMEYLNNGLGVFGIGSRGGSHNNNWPKDPVEFDKAMAWYQRAAQALRQQQLLEHAYVYTYDEPRMDDPDVARVMEGIHRADPGLKNLVVLQEMPDPATQANWLKDADILCIRIGSYDPEIAKQFKAMGKEIWIYVSSPTHPFPSLVIDYPAMAHRILPWMVWKYGATGLLYWCVDYWKGNPWEDPANFKSDQNGNGSLYYPAPDGPVPSVRMEALRDGIEDYEYLYRLNELLQLAKTKGGVDPSLVRKAEELVAVDPGLVGSLRSYAKDPAVLETQRRAIAELIEQLQTVVSP